MKSFLSVSLSLLALACLAGDGFAQVALLAGPGGGSVVDLETINGGNLFGAAAATGTESIVDLNFHFSFLRPYWASRSLALSVPGGLNSNLPIIGGTGNLPWSFTFVPRLDAEIDITSLGITTAASVEFISLTASLERAISTSAGSADLTASDNVTILVVNLIEVSKAVAVADFLSHPRVQDDVVQFTLGTRYTSVQQNYKATLRSGSNVSTADGNQNFSGLGLTAALHWTHPLSSRWSLYSTTRGSLLLGYNNRKSVVSVAAPGVPGGSFTNNLVENKTAVLPVGSLELGVEHAFPLGRPNAAGNDTIFFVRSGFVGQMWGTAGFLSASANNLSFSNRPLYLAGFSLVAGVQF